MDIHDIWRLAFYICIKVIGDVLVCLTQCMPYNMAGGNHKYPIKMGVVWILAAKAAHKKNRLKKKKSRPALEKNCPVETMGFSRVSMEKICGNLLRFPLPQEEAGFVSARGPTRVFAHGPRSVPLDL